MCEHPHLIDGRVEYNTMLDRSYLVADCGECRERVVLEVHTEMWEEKKQILRVVRTVN